MAAARRERCPPARSTRGTGEGLGCYATNIGTKPISGMTVALVRAVGLKYAQTCATLDAAIACATNSIEPPIAFCRATFKGSARNVRLVMYVYELVGSNLGAVLTAP